MPILDFAKKLIPKGDEKLIGLCWGLAELMAPKSLWGPLVTGGPFELENHFLTLPRGSKFIARFHRLENIFSLACVGQNIFARARGIQTIFFATFVESENYFGVSPTSWPPSPFGAPW